MTLFIKNMVCRRCIFTVAQVLEKNGITPQAIALGEVALTGELLPAQEQQLRADLVYRLRINVTDPDDRLRQGQPVTVRLELSPYPGADP